MYISRIGLQELWQSAEARMGLCCLQTCKAAPTNSSQCLRLSNQAFVSPLPSVSNDTVSALKAMMKLYCSYIG